MFLDSSDQIIRHTNIEDSTFTCYDISVKLILHILFRDRFLLRRNDKVKIPFYAYVHKLCFCISKNLRNSSKNIRIENIFCILSKSSFDNLELFLCHCSSLEELDRSIGFEFHALRFGFCDSDFCICFTLSTENLRFTLPFCLKDFRLFVTF